MNKFLSDFIVTKSKKLTSKYQLIEVNAPEGTDVSIIKPGQFVQVKVNGSQSTFLRRPISIHDVDVERQVISLLVCRAGDGTNAICDLKEGASVNIMWPLGNGFELPDNNNASVLLIGGGVGVAPLLYLSKLLNARGITPSILLAARTGNDLLQLDEFKKHGNVYTSTDDGSAGEKGLVTQHSILSQNFDIVYCCGPMPMMKAIAAICAPRHIVCQVSLENVMACGIGACLCCVEKTVKGNRCVCTDGPVFNIKELTW